MHVEYRQMTEYAPAHALGDSPQTEFAMAEERNTMFAANPRHEQEIARLIQKFEQLSLEPDGTGAGPEPPLSKDQLEQSAHVLESCSKL